MGSILDDDMDGVDGIRVQDVPLQTAETGLPNEIAVAAIDKANIVCIDVYSYFYVINV